jgi:hypothetical protein
MKPLFKLDSGRQIAIEQFFFQSTATGFLEGSPRAISKHVLEHLPNTIRTLFWDTQATLILKPAEEFLPAYTFIAHLQCMDCVPNGESGYYSRLLVAWFHDDIDATPVRLAHKALRKIDWDQHAENWVD